MNAPKKFQLLSPEELEQLPDLTWLIKGILPQTCLAVLYGDPGCGKTFVAISMALAASAGDDWLGRPSAPISVLYIAAEGVLGLKSRVAAHRAERGINPERIRFLPGAPNVLDEGELASLIKAVKDASFTPGLIVVDTLARVTTGADENNARDMGQAVAALDSLKEEFGAAVLVLHHKNKNGASERGSSALRGAADVMIAAEWTEAKNGPQIDLTCKKMKEAEPFKDMAAALKAVKLPNGSTSLVVSHAASPANIDSAKAESKILAILRIEFAETGATNSELWAAFKAAKYGSKSTFDRGLRALKSSDEVRVEGSGKGMRYFPIDISVTLVSD